MQGWQLQANEIADRVYVSDVYTATSERALKDLGITHVISLVEANTRLPVDVGAHLQIYIADNSKCDILEHFEDTTDFIRDALAINPSNRVLVHCVWGMSRSVSVAVAYLVATRDMFYHEAFEVVQNRRPLARPNDGFAKQIVRYAVEVGVPRRRSLKAVRSAREKAAAVQERTPVSFGPQTNFPQALSTMYAFPFGHYSMLTQDLLTERRTTIRWLRECNRQLQMRRRLW
ncbi:phosphatases II [Exidia glandulosa HHB12029]|uniref:protein-tyrosine-phosphatase n=1 Tax=Exidia glandulosa HHB12029 TaxID=1314781 RepID=A0A165QS10_EXIGL|nr:phosphatases II [Exidia glandulosa HHB12029]